MASTYYAWDYVDSEVPKGTYTEASYKATTKFRASHKEEYNKYMKDYHLKKMRTDLGYRERRAISQKKSNAKRREREMKVKRLWQQHVAKEERLKGIADTEEEEPKYKSVAQPLTLVVECSGIADTIKGY